MKENERMMDLFPIAALRNAIMNLDSTEPYILNDKMDDKEIETKLEEISEKILEEN